VDLCGEGEWFVGSRGGIADQAAIRGGERDKVSKIGFFPFRIEETIALPRELSVIIANSQVTVSKSHEARHTFNHRVACYDLAEMLLRKNASFLASMKHLRDLDPRKLGLSRAEIYRLLKQLPQETDRQSLLQQLPDQTDRVREIFSTHDDLGKYPLRGVALFGITECRRSDRFSRLLKDREFSQIGEMMRVSHDGDRIVRYHRGRSRPYAAACDDRQLDRLIRESCSPDSARREHASLWMQPGSYSCSTPKIDRIVDLAGAQSGVVGAQLSGAGLGGCAMILVRTEAVERILAHLTRTFYAAQGLEVEAYVCRPVAGSGLIDCR
jgi:N-acetylgalactosamine kinase